MAQRHDRLEQSHIDFIDRQHLFFVGTAGAEGFVNVSPKGMDSLRVVDPGRVLWLNLTGSGNETAAHVRENRRMTLMFCGFEKEPMILRLYGDAGVIHPRDAAWQELIARFPSYTGARQLFDLRLKLVQTSCGFAVPFYEHKGDRPTLEKWASKRGRAAIEQYWSESNTRSLDGKDTGIIPEG